MSTGVHVIGTASAPLVESGAAARCGALPVNVCGGHLSKAHAVGATGSAMVREGIPRLRGEAGARHPKGASLAPIVGGGGVTGFDEAVCAGTILETSS